MSKAFTREDDGVPETPLRSRRRSSLPPGAKNYLSAAGAERLRAELDRLLHTERPTLVALARNAETTQQLEAVDGRIDQLRQSLNSAVIVQPPAAPWDQVRFGADVTVKNRRGEEARYRIVGVDETDADRGWVSWLSPVAKALLNTQIGQRVRLKLPNGDEELEITAISYT